MKDRLQRSVRVTLTGLLVNTALAVGKTAAGVVGHSHALIADGVESLADILSSLVVWRGMVVASAPADEDHPYGHGKAEPMAAAFVASMLLFAALWIAVQAVREILRPHSLPAPFTLVVLIVVVVVKETLFRLVFKEGSDIESSAVKSDAWHHRSDAITSLCAGIGITVALIGGKGYEAADDVAALLASFIIGWNGWRLLLPAMDELMDVAPDPALVETIRATAAAVDGVQLVEKCLVRKAGYHHFVEMHIEVDPQMPVVRAHSIAHDVKDRVRVKVPAVRDVLVHIEPASSGGR
ncbi:MAG TPA: cation diffusion facilitator family transporter [Verrucomicrobiae bacterium]